MGINVLVASIRWFGLVFFFSLLLLNLPPLVAHDVICDVVNDVM